MRARRTLKSGEGVCYHADTPSIDIRLFPVLGDVEAGSLNFGIGSQAEKCFQREANNRAPDDRQDDGHDDGFHLRNKERTQQLLSEIAVRLAGRKKTGEQRTEFPPTACTPKVSNASS